MAMEKIVSPSGWDWDIPVASIMKLGNDLRMGPADSREFVKRAGLTAANLFASQMHNIKFAKDEIPVHLVALGASEAWGPNRNGDAFTEPTLKQAHDTFVKHAHWFRNHKNKKAEGHPHYGIVKASAYNPEMRRVELLVGLPATKQAADLLGCNGPADQELEKLAKGDDIPVSMACRVPYDVCSGCGHKASTREQYCKEASCRFGGCYNNLTRLVKTAGDVHLLHVRNDHPVFFDISKVFRPADRTAYGSKADWIKAASDGFFGIDGAKMAEELGVTAPMSVILLQDTVDRVGWRPYMGEHIKIAHGLAALEQQQDLWNSAVVKRAFDSAVQPPVDLVALDLQDTRFEKVAAGLAALADRKIILPLRDFARMTKRAALVEAAGARLPGVYLRMIEDGSLENRLATNPYVLGEKVASAKQRTAAHRMISTHALEKDAVDLRCKRSVLGGLPVPDLKSGFYIEKSAADTREAEELARDYSCYKVAALHRIAKFDDEFMLTARLSACQNHVI